MIKAVRSRCDGDVRGRRRRRRRRHDRGHHHQHCDADRHRHPRGDCQGADPSDTPAVAHRRFLPQPRPRLTPGTSLTASVQQARCRSLGMCKAKNFVIRIVFSKVFALANTDKSQICVAVSKRAGTDSSDAAHQDKTPPRIVRFQALTMARWSAGLCDHRLRATATAAVWSSIREQGGASRGAGRSMNRSMSG